MRKALLLVVLAVAALAACSGNGASPGGLTAPDPASVPAGEYDLRGTLVAVDRARRIVEIDQEEIPGVMPAMTMPYETAEGVALDALAAGVRVRGRLRVDARGYVIVSLQPA
jgi:protein SCO1